MGSLEKEPDRISINDSDGQTFYGYDDPETGTTDWYTQDGSLDTRTSTPANNAEE